MGYDDFFGRARDIAVANKIEYGLAEMALGAAVLWWGVQHDAIAIGTELVGLAAPGFNPAAAGAAGGASLGALAGSMIGGIGIAGAFGAIGVPAAILVGGASAVLAAAGYTAGDLIDKFVLDTDLAEQILPLSASVLGVGLMLHGAYRISQDERLAKHKEALRQGVLGLATVADEVVIATKAALIEAAQDVSQKPLAGISAASGTGIGAAVGGSAAAASVTVLGSQTLGGIALSLGLVSAPVWPVAVGVIAGGAAGYGLWKLATGRRTGDQPKLPPPPLQLLNTAD